MTREEAETLVGTLIACVNEAHAAVSYEWRDACWKAADASEERVVLALTGAQGVPSVPDVWLPVPKKHPTFDPVDLQLSDGSVLCGCIPQVDGDYWWEGPSGEVFIDPRYAPVTHWRLSAEPEAKAEAKRARKAARRAKQLGVKP